MATQTKKAKETKLLTARGLADLQGKEHGHPLESRDSHVRLRRTRNDILYATEQAKQRSKETDRNIASIPMMIYKTIKLV